MARTVIIPAVVLVIIFFVQGILGSVRRNFPNDAHHEGPPWAVAEFVASSAPTFTAIQGQSGVLSKLLPSLFPVSARAVTSTTAHTHAKSANSHWSPWLFRSSNSGRNDFGNELYHLRLGAIRSSEAGSPGLVLRCAQLEAPRRRRYVLNYFQLEPRRLQAAKVCP